jgi:hypothetical protein
MYKYTPQKIQRQTKFLPSDQKGIWNIIFEETVIGQMERRKNFGYVRYKIFDQSGKYLGTKDNKVEAKLYVAFNFINQGLIEIK